MEKNIFDAFQKTDALTEKDPKTFYECEARISGYFVTNDSILRLIKNTNHKWISTEYVEFKRRSIYNEKSVYRYRKYTNGTVESICKSKLFRDYVKNMWTVINISSEVKIYTEDNCEYSLPAYITRFVLIKNDCKIEIGYEKQQNSYWVEIERTDRSSVKGFMKTILWVIKYLQDSKYIASYSDTIVIRSAFDLYLKEYGKPITLTNDNLSNLLKMKFISGKYDGKRVFLISRMKKIFEIDLKNRVRYIQDSHFDDVLTILDCEQIENTYYIIDIPVHDGNYIGDMPSKERLKLRNKYEEYFTIKPFFEFHSTDQISYLSNNSDILLDGIIFLGNNYRNLLKWKQINTIDLFNKKGSLKTSDDKMIKIPIANMSEVPEPNNICEFEYIDNELVFLRYRDDKPFANSSKIVYENTKNAVSKDFFNGTSSYFMRKYHNSVKKSLLKRCKGKTLIDIGTGHGGDITKWNCFEKVHSIDPSKKSYEEYKVRMGNNSLDRKYILESIKHYNNVKDELEYADTVAAFFCINLFSDEDMQGLSDLLYQKCKSYFIGICLTNIDEYDNDCFTSHIFSNGVYSITIHETRVTDAKERIIDMSSLQIVLDAIGYDLIFQENLTQGSLLSSNEKILSSFYTQFIFCKKAL